MHRHPNYYPLRNHLVDFLFARSSGVGGAPAASDLDPRRPLLVYPGVHLLELVVLVIGLPPVRVALWLPALVSSGF